MKNRKFQHLEDTPFPRLDNVNVWDYKNEFDYNRWGDDAALKLVNVKWDSAYQHVPFFASATERDKYLDAKQGASEKLATRFYTLPKQEIKLPYPYAVVARYNYIVVDLPLMTGAGMPIMYEGKPRVSRWLYFCEAVEEKSPNTTLCRLSIDVWNTWLGEYEINSMMLERGHAPMKQITATNYLKNPLANTRYISAPDVTFGEINKTTARNVVIYNDDVWAVVSFNASILGTWGTKHTATWKTPSGNHNADGAPGTQLFAVARNDLWVFLNNIRSQIPQAFQAITAVFFVPKKLVNLSSSETEWAGTMIRSVAPSNWRSDTLVTLAKSQFSYNARYDEMAKLYTWPYSQLRVYDHSGNSIIVKIEETTGTLTARARASLTWPDLNISTYIDGIGTAANQTLTFANSSDKSYPWAGDVELTERTWGIPTYGVYMSAETDYDVHNWYANEQRKKEIANTYDNTLKNAQVSYDNTLASLETTYDIAELNAETALSNTRKTNQTGLDNARASADTARTNADRSANTAKANADRSADNAYSTSVLSADTARDNAYDNADVNYQMGTNAISTGNKILFATTDFNEENFQLQAESAELQRALGARVSYIGFQSQIANNTLSMATQLPAQVMAGGLQGPVGALAGAANASLGAFTTMVSQMNDETFLRYNNAANTQYEEEMYGISGWGENYWLPGGGLLVNHNKATTGSLNGRIMTLNNNNAREITKQNNLNSQASRDTSRALAKGGYLWAVPAGDGSALVRGGALHGTAVRTNETAKANATNSRNTAKANSAATQTAALANNTATRDTARANALRSWNATEANAVRSRNAANSNNVDSYNTGLKNAKRSLANAKEVAKANSDTANAGVTASIKQAGLGAPVQAGTFANGETATTRPIAWFAQIETQPIGAIEQTAHEFARYGYTLGQWWEVSTLNYGKHFTYWQSEDVWFSKCDLPTEALNTLRVIFANGVTVWRDADKIGTVGIFDN